MGEQVGAEEELHYLRLSDGGSVQDHIKEMTEVFQSLAEMDSPLTEEDDATLDMAMLLPETMIGRAEDTEEVDGPDVLRCD